ncbi:MAG: putative transcriptional regulator, Crp/Fnr family [Hyphomicrobiales bacterium]|nr:putative transcriptional regulator, Crp/Fnr family [Hyphomicrobiales bacterium]
MARPGTKNGILKRLKAEDFNALEPFLKPVTLSPKQDLSLPGRVVEYVHFIEEGICSVEAIAPGSEAIEVGLIGPEGVTDHVQDPGDTSPLHVLVQVGGSALAVRAGDYANWIEGRLDALRLMVRYQQAMTIQISFTALAHGSFSLEERLSRLLLMLFDRTEGHDLPFVHERLARMLSVRRAGVTSALHMLEGLHAVKVTRGIVTLRDRSTLETLSAGSYGIPEKEYARLLGSIPQD